MDNSYKQRCNSSIIIDARVNLIDCELNTSVDTERRFCFEIASTKPQPSSFALQAETEEEMQDWITAFIRHKSESSTSRPPSLRIKSKANPTIALSSPASPSPRLIQEDTLSNNSSSSSIHSQQTALAEGSSLTKNYNDQYASIVMVSTTPDAEASLENTSSLTPLLVWEAARIICSSTKKVPSSSWGIPWSLVPTMVNLSQDKRNLNESTPVDLPQIVWPAKPVPVDIPKITIPGYTDKLNAHNRELRRLFSGVQSQEVVLDVFGGCLRKKPKHPVTREDIASIKSSSAWTSADVFENQLIDQLVKVGVDPPSIYGYAYTGRGFVTQDTFWFYSCILMTCINTVG